MKTAVLTAQDAGVDVDTAGLESIRSRVPHLGEYFGQWAMHGPVFRSMADAVSRMDLAAHVLAVHKARGPGGGASVDGGFEVVGDGVAVIHLDGVMMKTASSLSRSTSTVAVRKQVRAAADDPKVRAILLKVDSPGGSVSGTADLAADIAAAGEQKTVHAFIEDIGASAAFWVASQAERVLVNSTAQVGSIGTFGVIHDESEAAAKAGVTVHVVRAGDFKGAGEPGTEVTGEQLADAQRVVDSLNEQFIGGVARGRGMSAEAVGKLADGRVHVGEQAVLLGLADAVSTFDEAVAGLSARGTAASRLNGRANVTRAEQEIAMSSAAINTGQVLALEQVPPAAQAGPASYDEVVTACKGADEAFICGQLKAKATVEQARDAWVAQVSAKNAELSKSNEELSAQNDKLVKDLAGAGGAGLAGRPGAEAEGSDLTMGGGDPLAAFKALVAEKVKAGSTRMEAVRAAVAENPQLHAASLAAANAG